MVVALVVESYRHTLKPIPPFTWLGWGVSTLDVVAMIRLCVVLRQLRELSLKTHIRLHGKNRIDDDSFVRKAAATLLIICGGEAIVAPFLGITPSFMTSAVAPVLYTLTQAVVEYLPAVPDFRPEIELPLSLLDGFSRAYLLCDLIPPAVTAHSSPLISASPWSLILSSFIMANAGFFFTTLFSLLEPTPLTVQTPPELKAYGWTTADVWCAPLGTALYAFLTHAQPFWVDLHSVVSQSLGGSEPVKPLSPEYARAVCASFLITLFIARTIKNFGLWKKLSPEAPKQKTQ